MRRFTLQRSLPRSPLVRGRIRQGDGAGIPGALLTLIDPRAGRVTRATTGGDGEYLLPAPGAGSYVLIASAPCRRPDARTVVAEERRPTEADLMLAGTARLAGTITAGPSGEPVAGATVMLANLSGDVISVQAGGTDGHYAFRALHPGRYVLIVSTKRHPPAAQGVTVPETGRVRYDVELAPGGPLRGTVRTAAGRAVPGARVTLIDATGDVVAVAETDESGGYDFDSVPGGDYTLVAAGYPAATSTVHATGGRDTRHDVSLRHPSAPGSLRGSPG